MTIEPVDEAIIPRAEPVAKSSGPLTGLLRDSSLYFLGNVAFKVIGFVMIPFYTHFLSPEQSGVLNLIELAIQIVAIAFGLQAAGTALARIWHDQTTDAARRHTVSTAILGLGGVAAAVSLLAGILAEPIARALSLGGDTQLLRLAFAAMFFSSMGEIALVYERMQNRARFFLAYSLVTLAATLVLNVTLIGFAGMGVRGFILAKLAIAVCGSSYLLSRIFRECGVQFRGAIAVLLARFATPLIASGAAYLAIHFSDRLFLAHFSKAEVGVYAMAYNFAFLISVIIGDSFTKVWNVSLYSYASGEGYQARLAQVGRWLIIVLGTSAVGISLFARDVLTVMVPRSYYPPALMLPVLVFAYFLREVGDFFNSTLLVGQGSGLVGRIAILGALFNLLLNALLIPPLGIWGAAWATFLTWAVYCAICWLYAARHHRLPIAFGPFLLVLVLSVLALGGRAIAGSERAATNVALDGVWLVVFSVAAWFLYLRQPERREALLYAGKVLAKVQRA